MPRCVSRKPLLFALFISVSASSGPVAAGDLLSAVKARNPEQVEALLKAGADPNRRSSYGAPINLAAGLGSLEIVVDLLDAGADPHVAGFGGATPLHAAALSGQMDVAKVLLERGARVDARDNLGRIPLLTYASSATHNLDLLKVLLRVGANPNAVEDATGISVLDHVAAHGNADETALLIAAGAKIDSRDKLFGRTPLHFATDCCLSTTGSFEVVKSLIDHGADVNAKDVNGSTAIDNVRRCAPHSGLMLSILKEAGGR
jgi:ankyrin repeat protein